ncbi:MAG: class I SAM-dependent methyltransferase [Eubacteriales bacterium]|nr:class I SAM-dependent methyltransferase [Eubacteriales bacterium]
MDAYTSFAYVYDTFMDQEPYEEWADRVCAFLEKYGLPQSEEGLYTDVASPDMDDIENERRIVVDLGCGTGKFTELLAGRGYDMIGIDLSEDMLAIAQERRISSGLDILYSLQDMRDFELYGAAGAMVSVGDSINYLLEEEGLESMFRCVQRALLPGGVFVFDFKTIHLYRDVIGDRTIAEDRGACAFIWDNYYDPETCINEYDLAVFVAQDLQDLPRRHGCLFRRYDEVHRQRGYEPDQLQRAAEKAGLVWITARDAETGGPVTAQTGRVMAAVRRQV